MSAMSAGARSVEVAQVWEYFAPGETGEAVVKTIRSEPTGCSVNKGTGRRSGRAAVSTDVVKAGAGRRVGTADGS